MSSKKDEKSLLSDVTIRILDICNLKKVKPIFLIKNNVGAQQTVYDVLKGKQKPGIDFLMKFLELFPDIDSNWLLLGDGKMLKSSNHQTSKNIIKGEKNITGNGINLLNEPDKEYGDHKALLASKDREIEALKKVIETQEKLIDRLTK